MRLLPGFLFIGLANGLGLTPHAAALEAPKNHQARQAFCAEESRAAMQWVDWAYSEKIRCLTLPDEPSQASCLDGIRANLKKMESDHAKVYDTQIQALRPGHPVRKTLIQRLKNHSQWASLAVDGSIEPGQIALTVQSSCMNQR